MVLRSVWGSLLPQHTNILECGLNGCPNKLSSFISSHTMHLETRCKQLHLLDALQHSLSSLILGIDGPLSAVSGVLTVQGEEVPLAIPARLGPRVHAQVPMKSPQLAVSVRVVGGGVTWGRHFAQVAGGTVGEPGVIHVLQVLGSEVQVLDLLLGDHLSKGLMTNMEEAPVENRVSTGNLVAPSALALRWLLQRWQLLHSSSRLLHRWHIHKWLLLHQLMLQGKKLKLVDRTLEAHLCRWFGSRPWR
jgi:hypothetical protein